MVQQSYRILGRYKMGGGGGIVNMIVGAALVVVGIFAEGISFGTSTSLVVMGLSMMASAVISATTPAPGTVSSGSTQLNTGTTVQLQPQTSNKLPVVYGTSFVGGAITDLSITSDNQNLYFVISLCEVTGNGTDNITIGDIYYQGKKCVFDGPNVTGLIDPSTGLTDTSCNGYLSIYTYSNGSSKPLNSSTSAIALMQSSGLTYTWDNSKLMNNTVFAIVHLTYNQGARTTSLGSTQFEIINPRNSAGDCIYDYLTNTVYGAAIPSSQIDTASLTALNTYCNEVITFTPYSGGSATQPRFKFNGVIDNKSNVLSTLQNITSCCDCLLKYNEIYGIWSVIVQTPSYSVVMDINDSNITGAISVQTMDISNVYNIADCQFPDLTLQSAFNTATVDLSIVDPALLYPNEPTNSQTVKLPLVNNNVQAQLLATRFLKAARLDLSIKATINYIGLELEAGDVVTVTNANYGWTAKLFRVMQVVQNFQPDGSITVDLNLQTYDPNVFNDVSITQYTPPANTGLSNPNVWGTLYAPTIIGSQPTAANPSFQVSIESSSAGVTQYAEVWYSAFSSPSTSQLIFAGTTAIQSNGVPYGNSTTLPAVTLTNIPAGNWYFFTRMVNSLGTSIYSPASSVFQWRPTTFQFTQRYLSVAYADTATGGGFSLNPRGKAYYGLFNQSGTAPSTTASDYTWYQPRVNFGTVEYLLYCNRTGRKFSFDEGFAGYASGTASFVPTQTVTFDPSIWAALADGINVIDLDLRTGQLTQVGTTTVGTGQVAITNNPDGTIISSLQKYLDFGGPYTKTSAVATLTIDVYGRVVGFQTPDDFDYTRTNYIATAGQTVFNQTRASSYISGQCWVLQNGLLLDTSQYTDTGGSTGNVTLAIGANSGDLITIISFRSVNSSTGVYASFTRNSATLSNQATYTVSGFTLNDGYELLFLNGTIVNAQDYNLSGQTINFIQNVSGDLQVIQWSQNNLGVANGTPVNIDAYTVIGQTIYPFSFDSQAFNLYNNGILLATGTDYTTSSGSYTLSTAPTTILNILVQQTFARTGAV
jgi:hypothetical protein